MKYNDLVVSKNADRKRVGRGISAGQGKTAGRGTKGQKSQASRVSMQRHRLSIPTILTVLKAKLITSPSLRLT